MPSSFNPAMGLRSSPNGLWQSTRSSRGASPKAFDGASSGVAAAAVGGYGRRQLFPYSDVDLLLLVKDNGKAAAKQERIGRLLTDLWDSQLRVSQSVRAPADCINLTSDNTELHISLLDTRFLCGDEAFFREFAETKLPKFYLREQKSLVRELVDSARNRWRAFGNTIYHPRAEREGRSGRDARFSIGLLADATREPVAEQDSLQPGVFASRLRPARGRSHRIPLCPALLSALFQRAGQEPPLLRPARDRRSRGRRQGVCRGARRSRLDARILPQRPRYQPPGRAHHGRAHGCAELSRPNLPRPEIQNFQPPFHRQQRENFRARSAATGSAARVGARNLRLHARHGLPLAAKTERRIEAQLPAVRKYLDAHRSHWRRCAKSCSRRTAYAALRAMRETGVLFELLPAFKLVDCLVIRDFYHRYTVDEHILVTIRVLRAQDQRRQPRQPFRPLLEEIDRPELVYFALLFHDLGKGVKGRNHSAVGAELAEEAMDRIGLTDRSDRETILYLIREHLAMSAVMTKRDISETETLEDFKEQVGTIERLKMLTVLTFADTSGVNPRAMSAWRKDLLWQLYLGAHHIFTRDLETSASNPTAKSCCWSWPATPGEGQELRAFLKGFPYRYLRTHAPQQIYRHYTLSRELTPQGAVIDIRNVQGHYVVVALAASARFCSPRCAARCPASGSTRKGRSLRQRRRRRARPRSACRYRRIWAAASSRRARSPNSKKICAESPTDASMRKSFSGSAAPSAGGAEYSSSRRSPTTTRLRPAQPFST